MKSRIMISLLVIALAAAMIGGGTMAWFTAKDEAPENEFTAGTVMLEVGDEEVYDEHEMDNVNPGDCFLKCVEVKNIGSKDMELRLTGVEFDFDINWEWVNANLDELCFGDLEFEGNDINSLQDAVDAAIDAGDVRAPHKAGDKVEGQLFDSNGNLIVPGMVAPCPDSGWVLKYVDNEWEMYYDGPLAPGDSTELCVVVYFEGPWMGNLWQNATFTIGGDDAQFEAVQASNNAPSEVWGSEVWEDYREIADEETCYESLKTGTGEDYANYFYPLENGERKFKFIDCCSQNNDNNNEG